jgi:hypothetical protein
MIFVPQFNGVYYLYVPHDSRMTVFSLFYICIIDWFPIIPSPHVAFWKLAGAQPGVKLGFTRYTPYVPTQFGLKLAFWVPITHLENYGVGTSECI